MKITRTNNSATEVELTIIAEAADLQPLKEHVLEKLAPRVKVAGFRPGKAPLNIVEKNLDQNLLLDEFLNEAVNHLYSDALNQEKLRSFSQPTIELKKFVPYSLMEFTAQQEVIGDVKLPNLSTIKVAKPSAEVTEEEVQNVIANLQKQAATKQEVDRASQEGDEVWIDFVGTDAKGQPVKGADGKDYPLALGSKTFIPGFEENLLGLKAGDKKTFKIKFPADYSVKALQSKNVTFEVTVNIVKEVAEPKADDAFAASVGPLKTIKELKEDIKKQLGVEKSRQVEREYEDDILRAVSAKTTVELPASLVDEQVRRMEEDEKRNLVYRGQTWQEHLDDVGQTEEEHRVEKRAEAEERVKAGLVLSEIADQNNLGVTAEELEVRLQVLKGQYQDEAMQAELDKPENRQEVANRLLTEKSILKLKELVSK